MTAGREAISGNFGDGCGEHLIYRRREIGPALGQDGRRLSQLRVHHRHRFLAAKRGAAAEQLECRAGQRVLVSLAVDELALDLLGSDVVERAEKGSCIGEPRGLQRPPPGTNPIAMNSTPLPSPPSNTGMMCGSSTAAAARDSLMNRCLNASSAARARARLLRATLPSSRPS